MSELALAHDAFATGTACSVSRKLAGLMLAFRQIVTSYVPKTLLFFSKVDSVPHVDRAGIHEGANMASSVGAN
jgi:hypothetical protein